VLPAPVSALQSHAELAQQLATPLRLRVFVVGLACLLALGARAQTPASPYRLRTEKCSVPQDLFESMRLDAAEEEARIKPGLPPESIRGDILDRLETVDLDTLEKFFRCFSFDEGHVSDGDRRQGVIRVLTAFIVVGSVDLPTSPNRPGETTRFSKSAHVTCHQKADGTRWCQGSYGVE
jgi:hypothetical protein